MAMWKKDEENILAVEKPEDEEEINVVIVPKHPVRTFFKKVWNKGKYVIVVVGTVAVTIGALAIAGKIGGEDEEEVIDIPYEETEVEV